MASTVFPAPAAGKTRRTLTLTSGTSWTVPASVDFVNVTLVGGGGGGGGNGGSPGYFPQDGTPGQVILSTLTTTPGASITYAIGAGGSGGTGGSGSAGGTTTFTGATSATGGNGGAGANNNLAGATGTVSRATNHGSGSGQGSGTASGGTGGSGYIEVEYWI